MNKIFYFLDWPIFFFSMVTFYLLREKTGGFWSLGPSQVMEKYPNKTKISWTLTCHVKTPSLSSESILFFQANTKIILPGLFLLIRFDVIIPTEGMTQVGRWWAGDGFKYCHICLWWHIPADDTNVNYTHFYKERYKHQQMNDKRYELALSSPGYLSCFAVCKKQAS